MKFETHDTKWLPMTLSLFVLPGMGHFYAKKKIKGYVFASAALMIAIAAFARYMSVLFALANVRGASRPPSFSPWILLVDAWRLDQRVMVAFLFAFLLVWAGAALDLWITLRGRQVNEP